MLRPDKFWSSQIQECHFKVDDTSAVASSWCRSTRTEMNHRWLCFHVAGDKACLVALSAISLPLTHLTRIHETRPRSADKSVCVWMGGQGGGWWLWCGFSGWGGVVWMMRDKHRDNERLTDEFTIVCGLLESSRSSPQGYRDPVQLWTGGRGLCKKFLFLPPLNPPSITMTSWI